MTKVLLQCDKDGRLVSCSANGHAGYAKSGSDIVCSAVTILMRTTLQVLSESDLLELKVNAEKPGSLSFSAKIKSAEKSSELESKLLYSGQFLESGFNSLAEEFPEYVKITKEII